MAMVNTPVRQQKRGSLIAGIGALVGIGAFLLLPYLNVTVTVTNNNNGFSNPQTNSVAYPVGTGFISVFSGLIWVEGLLAIAVLVLAALVMWRDVPFGASTTPVEAQIRRVAYAMLLLEVAGIAFQFLFTSIGNGQINNLLQSISIGTFQSFSATTGYAVGSWIYLIGMCVAILGGVLMLRTGTVPVSSPQTLSQPQSWPQYPPYQQTQQQGWPQPYHPQPMWPQPPQPPQPQQGWQQPPTQGWQQPPTS